MPRVKPRAAWLHGLQTLIVLAILAAIGFVLMRSWQEIRQVAWRPEPAPALLATCLMIIAVLEAAFAWAWLTRQLDGCRIALEKITSVFLYGNTARYLPGSIWNYLARGYLGSQEGLAVRRVWTASLGEILGITGAGFLVYLVSLAWPHNHIPLLPIPALLACLGLALLVSSPPVMRGLSQRDLPEWFPRWPGLPSNPEQAAVAPSALFRYMLVLVPICTQMGLAFYVFARSLYPLPLHYLPEATGLWNIAILLGLLALGVPHGLGVREGLLAWGLSAALPAPAALAIAVLARLWVVICELLATGFWWLYQWGKAKYYQSIIDDQGSKH